MYVSAYADTFYMKRPYALYANGLRNASRPAIARIKIGCAPTLLSFLGTNNGDLTGRPC